MEAPLLTNGSADQAGDPAGGPRNWRNRRNRRRWSSPTGVQRENHDRHLAAAVRKARPAAGPSTRSGWVARGFRPGSGSGSFLGVIPEPEGDVPTADPGHLLRDQRGAQLWSHQP